MSGEQFALSDAVERLRETRRTPPDGRVLAICAADPLNLTGVVGAGERVRAVATNRVAYRNGVAVAALEGDYLRSLVDPDEAAGPLASEITTVLTGRQLPAVTSGYVGR
jgi:ATP-dependent Lhr-like helicase